MLFTTILRVVFAQIIGSLWLNDVLKNTRSEFVAKFGTEIVHNDPAHIEFFMHNKIIYYILFFYFFLILIGALYHSILNSSGWKATIGKRIMNMQIVKSDGKQLSFLRALSHYFLSLLPMIFLLHLMFFQLSHKTTFFESVIATNSNVFFGILFVVWTQISFFTKQKTTAYDLICMTVFVEGKSEKKFPWK
jgi:uncharacterized RDD family membrane protein YckC